MFIIFYEISFFTSVSHWLNSTITVKTIVSDIIYSLIDKIYGLLSPETQAAFTTAL